MYIDAVPTERGEPEPIRVTFPKSIQGWLRAQTDEEIGGRRVRCSARHRDRAVQMPEAGDAGALEFDRRKPVVPPTPIDPGLDDLDQDVLAGLVVQAHRAMEPPAVVHPGVDVAQVEQESGRDPGHRR